MPRAKGSAVLAGFPSEVGKSCSWTFHLAASSTAISAGKYCDRAGKWTSLQSSSTHAAQAWNCRDLSGRWSSGRRWPALSQSGADRLPPLRRAPRRASNGRRKRLDTWAPMTFTTAASIGQSPGRFQYHEALPMHGGAVFSAFQTEFSPPREPRFDE